MKKHYRSLARPILLACLSITLLAVPCPAQSLRLHWSEDGQRAWFRAENADGQAEFSIVDIPANTDATIQAYFKGLKDQCPQFVANELDKLRAHAEQGARQAAEAELEFLQMELDLIGIR